MELILKILGGLTAALIAIAASVYGVQKALRRDGRDEMDADMLGRGKMTIFEQYEGIIKRMVAEQEHLIAKQDRYQAEIERQAQQITNLSTRSVQHETELIEARRTRSDFAAMLLSVKREQEELMRSGRLKRPLLDVDTDILR